MGVRGSPLPALLAPPLGTAVVLAAPLAGPPLPLAGDLLAGLPVVLQTTEKQIVISRSVLETRDCEILRGYHRDLVSSCAIRE